MTTKPEGKARTGMRGFRLLVERADSDRYGLALQETNGTGEHARIVARSDSTHTPRVLTSVLAALRESDVQKTTLGPQRRAPIGLAEPAGVRLALVLMATRPVAKSSRIHDIVEGVAAMTTEEAYYWYAKCTGPDLRRARRALRILLAEE